MIEFIDSECIFNFDPYQCSFAHFMDKDKFSVHRMGQIYYRYNSSIPLVLFDKYNKFQAFQIGEGTKKFNKLPVSGDQKLIDSIPKQYETCFIIEK